MSASASTTKLYISTVFCEVFRLNHQGNRLDTESVRTKTPARGALIFEPYSEDPRPGKSRARFRVRLVTGDEKTNVLPPMVNALVLHINARGIKIVGTEMIARGRSIKSRLDYYDQIWVCKPAR